MERRTALPFFRARGKFVFADSCKEEKPRVAFWKTANLRLRCVVFFAGERGRGRTNLKNIVHGGEGERETILSRGGETVRSRREAGEGGGEKVIWGLFP